MGRKKAYLNPAILKCYKDYSCTEELEKDGQVYTLTLGTEDGFNGTDGDTMFQDIYIKNCGDSDALDTIFKEVGDNANYFKISVRSYTLADYLVQIGTIAPNEVVKVKISSYIPKGATAIDSYISYTLTYESIPPFEAKYYIDNIAPDIVKIKTSKKSTDGKIEEEYTIKNIEKLFDAKESITTLKVTPAMRTPVKIYHGTTDEIYWDNSIKKYKVRLKCPNCDAWTSWFNLDTFDYNAEIICSKCSHKIKVANTVNISEEPKNIDILTKEKVPLNHSQWVLLPSTNTYSLKIENSENIVSINAYKKEVTSFKKIMLNIYLKDNYIFLESLSPFDGYLLLLKNEQVAKEKFRPQLGMAYGKGLYGNPLYGQESFIHIIDTLEVDIPIKGQDSSLINADYKIVTKYTGNEDSIEDIQSYCTDRYMRLGCYDGPALPLKLDSV